MKLRGYIFILMILIQTIGVISCSDGKRKSAETHSDLGKILKGEHKVREIQNDSNGVSYFMVERDETKNPYLIFQWEISENEYVVSKLTLIKVRVKVDAMVSKPYITFRWIPDSDTDIRNAMRNNIKYMVFHCKA